MGSSTREMRLTTFAPSVLNFTGLLLQDQLSRKLPRNSLARQKFVVSDSESQKLCINATLARVPIPPLAPFHPLSLIRFRLENYPHAERNTSTMFCGTINIFLPVYDPDLKHRHCATSRVYISRIFHFPFRRLISVIENTISVFSVSRLHARRFSLIRRNQTRR